MNSPDEMKLDEIKAAIAQLPATEVRQLTQWLAEYLAIASDIEIEADTRAGRTDRLIQRAKAEIAAHQHHH